MGHHGPNFGSIESLTLCETNMAMKNGPVEDVFPIEHGDFPLILLMEEIPNNHLR